MKSTVGKKGTIYDEDIYYGTYIKVEQLINACETRSKINEEALFIRVHQAIEIVWAQCIQNIRYVIEDNLTHVERASVVLNQVRYCFDAVNQIILTLMGMPVKSFHDFRIYLGTSSGR